MPGHLLPHLPIVSNALFHYKVTFDCIQGSLGQSRMVFKCKNSKINCICNNPLSKSGNIYGFWELGDEPSCWGRGHFLFLLHFIIFVFGFAGSSSLCTGSSLVTASGGLIFIVLWGLLTVEVSLVAQPASRVHGLLSSWSEQAQLPLDMWDLSQTRAGIKPVPPLVGRFLTSGPQGKSWRAFFTRDKRNKKEGRGKRSQKGGTNESGWR